MVSFALFIQTDLQAKRLNKDIFETIYYHALRSSSELAAKDGPYETYCGSPVSKVRVSDFISFSECIPKTFKMACLGV